MKTSVLTVLLQHLVLLDYAFTLNILGIFPYQGKSHFFVFRVYLRALAERGHNVTVISHFPEQNPPLNYHDISLAGSLKAIEGDEPFENCYQTLLSSSFYLANSGTENCEVMLANKQVQNLVKEKQKFDVIAIEQFNSDCALGIAYKLEAPVVGMTSHVLMPYHFKRFGIPNNPAYVSFHFLEGGTKPTLFQRVERVIFDFYFRFVYYFLCQRIDQNTLAKYFNDIPPLEELGRDIKFLLLYHNFALTGSKLLPSNVIEVGGYHVTTSNPLTGDLKDFFDKAEYGIIYISFGSMVKAATMPAETVQVMLEVMKELPQKFVWKWEDETLVYDKNKLYTASWLPQVDILAHPKTLAFVSHAGNGGTTEAIHYGVPMVAIPVTGDQPCNAAAIEESGFGVQLHIRNLNKKNLINTLKEVLDPKMFLMGCILLGRPGQCTTQFVGLCYRFRQNSKTLSSAWHNRPMPPLETAIFWTEFAAKYSNFTFRTPAADVPLYQHVNLDIAMVLIGVFSLIFILCSKIVRSICCYSSNGSKTTQKRVKPKKKKS